MDISLDALQVLDAIDRKGSFAAAASSLHRVPSAVSYSVQKLEQDLGIALFQKQGRRAIPTKAGTLLIEQGRALLQAAEQLSLDAQQLATGWEPRLRIALDHSIPDSIVMNAIEALYAAQPRIEISVEKEVLGGTWEALLEGRAELAIGAVDSAPSHKGIHHEPWLRFLSCSSPRLTTPSARSRNHSANRASAATAWLSYAIHLAISQRSAGVFSAANKRSVLTVLSRKSAHNAVAWAWVPCRCISFNTIWIPESCASCRSRKICHKHPRDSPG